MYGQALLDIPCIKIIMGTDGKNLQETKELYNLTDVEEELLESKKRGHALFIIGSKRLHVNFEIPLYNSSTWDMQEDDKRQGTALRLLPSYFVFKSLMIAKRCSNCSSFSFFNSPSSSFSFTGEPVSLSKSIKAIISWPCGTAGPATLAAFCPWPAVRESLWL